MGKLKEFLQNKEPLKIGIMDYESMELDVVHCSNEYYMKHRHILKRPMEKEISEREFIERLYNYLWISKVSEAVILLYLLDQKGQQPTIYGLNRLLKRTPLQYSATFKTVSKLAELEIVRLEGVFGSARGEKKIIINKQTTRVYGDDEFRQMMVDEWDLEGKAYMGRKLGWLLKEKEKIKKILK
jgi:hypothetical protein